MAKILVVDKKKSVYQAIEVLFEDRGYQVIYAPTGKDGLDMVRSEKPEVVILDMWLKDMSGLLALQEIKKINPGCRVIVLTTSLHREDKRLARELGADACISKPFCIYELSKLVEGE